MTDIESLKFQLEAEKHAYTRNAEELIRQRDEAKAFADQWEYRAGDWMIRCEDAEAEVERLKKQADALRAQVEVALEALDERRRCAPGEAEQADAEVSVAMEDLRNSLSAPPNEPAYNFSANPEWIPSAHAEKVLIAVAKAAAQVGADDYRRRSIEAMQRAVPRLAKNAAYRDFETNMGLLIEFGHDIVALDGDEP